VLFVLFSLGDDRYALDAREIVEVLPRVQVRKILRLPRGAVGVFGYRGAFVPAVDVSELALGAPAPTRLSTRIILVRYPQANGTSHLLGLILEHATEIMRCDVSAFRPPGIADDVMSYRGPIAAGPGGLVQQIALKRLLPESLCESLFKGGAASR
jgi:chemotaxis-related protein WspB